MARSHVIFDDDGNVIEESNPPAGRPESRQHRAKRQDESQPQTRLRRIYEHPDTRDDALTRLRTIELLRENLRKREQRLVSFSKDKGATWAEIGNLYGISKQAAQQRWGSSPPS
jgi:DNA-directed RNA polymerase specialized sigma subunit